jgi:DNA-binding CsgD family transcriptional regulator
VARSELREMAQRLAGGGDLGTVGNAAADACERLVPFGTFNWVAAEPGVNERPSMVVRSTAIDPAWGLRNFPLLLVALERELGGMKAILDSPQAYDVFEKFPLSTLRRTEVLNDYFLPARSDQQIAAPLWSGGAPVGFFCTARSRRELRFDADDLRAIEEIRVIAERALASIVSLGAPGISRTLDALTGVFPLPAFLFDGCGRLHWASDEGLVRLGVASAHVGSGRILAGNALLEPLARQARALASDPVADAEGALRREGILRSGERLASRRFDEAGGPSLLLLAISPAMAALPGEAPGRATARIPGLGAAESRVARLAAEGYTVLNMSARMGVSESTVRTHLRRVYVKLGVHGRAELASQLLRGVG